MTSYTKIRFRTLKNGLQSIYLDTIYQGQRCTTTLGFVVKKNPGTYLEQQERRDALAFARQAANKKDTQLILNERDIQEPIKTNGNFYEYANRFIEEHKGIIDIRSYSATIKKLQKFSGKDRLSFADLSESFLSKYFGYLQKEHRGITPYNYFKKLKRIIRTSVKDKFLRNDPTENIKLTKGRCNDKDVLSLTEIKILWLTPCSNNNIKYGFLFCCLTGLRFCDVNELKWTDIKQGKIEIVQRKTKIKVTVPLSIDAQQVLLKMNDESNKIFDLPSHTSCLSVLRNWVKDSEIKKHITWHCARHSLGTNLIAQGVDVAVASKILGHTNLEQTSRYIRVHEDLKVKAMEKFTQSFI